MSIRCLIVDDEPLAQRVVEKYIEQIPALNLAAKCSNALEAIDPLAKESIDIIFLDINMPSLSGVEFLRSLKNPPLVIITTAYPEYALEGFELDVVDYLLKPIPFERFVKAVNKAIARLQLRSVGNGTPAAVEAKNSSDQLSLTVKADKRIYKIPLSSIIYIEGMGDYVTVYSAKGKIIAHDTMKRLEEELRRPDFIRVHKSYIISAQWVDYVEGNSIKVGDTMIPIGKSYRDEVYPFFE
ncbi:LytR/AlgR family response regulator transcription factor [Alistipes sp. ZOR0009]|uniref:LytR/AlgR family response regulator transcription factor n=1 Tax=Alistipes sp. ZOR0009 TaxID=1339253 RepID=UPI0006468A63|nr:LytTR family DNA-binding domain-containing protein [Alistipes sp. ZOR0009]